MKKTANMFRIYLKKFPKLQKVWVSTHTDLSLIHICLCDVEIDKNTVKTKMKQLKVFLSPINIGNAIYHGRQSSNVKID